MSHLLLGELRHRRPRLILTGPQPAAGGFTHGSHDLADQKRLKLPGGLDELTLFVLA
ncbi:MAG TPA: hypothetical protein VGK29_13755 [Paludibaculum sp.]